MWPTVETFKPGYRNQRLEVDIEHISDYRGVTRAPILKNLGLDEDEEIITKTSQRPTEAGVCHTTLASKGLIWNLTPAARVKPHSLFNRPIRRMG